MTDINDDERAGRIRALLTQAVANLDPADRDQRIAFCREHNQHGVRMHLSKEDDLIEFRWGGRTLAMVHRDHLDSDAPLHAEFIITDLPDTPEGLMP
ncbi:hypothetical protein MHAE_04390 [Mycobacterium haemophilum DSM 44634]|uniref:hypothetical protein n=1 Tax=Mycobacterium haemophilum TaxID=29311 RepID=UPI0006560571|nr:hypothetical protein [Mycobacterium haemophilum]AKN17472.1 hypothetical protein B586_14255 [Mycobacterium haemophilum DSM 44634]MCV7341595.1 hypothetical protein [Mycobacterium haemophilum DSM 44634]